MLSGRRMQGNDTTVSYYRYLAVQIATPLTFQAAFHSRSVIGQLWQTGHTSRFRWLRLHVISV